MATSMTLYALDELRSRIDDRLLEAEGELTPEIEQELDSWNVAADEKTERVGLYIREQIARADAIKAEAQRLIALEASARRGIDGLKGYLLSRLLAWGKTKVVGDLLTVTVQKNGRPKFVPLVDITTTPVPDILSRVIPARVEWDDTKLLATWKTKPELLAGFVTAELGNHVRFR